MGSLVSLVRVQNSGSLKNAILKALSLIDFDLRTSALRTVVIKPNLCYYWPSSTGYTTDPDLVAGIIDVIRENLGSDIDIRIAESDATAMRTKHVFRMLGYTKLAEKKKVDLFNLSEDILEERKVKINGQELTFMVPKLLIDSDLFINVPKLKVMREVVMTCALKNLFGCIGSSRKIVYHPHLNEAIAGISQVLKPHLTVVDGLVALGEFPVRLGLIIGGTDPCVVDWVAAQIMSFNPSKIKYLRLAASQKNPAVKNIIVRGENIEALRREFPRVNSFKSRLSWDLQLNLLKLYSRVVKDTVPDELEGA